MEGDAIEALPGAAVMGAAVEGAAVVSGDDEVSPGEDDVWGESLEEEGIIGVVTGGGAAEVAEGRGAAVMGAAVEGAAVEGAAEVDRGNDALNAGSDSNEGSR